MLYFVFAGSAASGSGTTMATANSKGEYYWLFCKLCPSLQYTKITLADNLHFKILFWRKKSLYSLVPTPMWWIPGLDSPCYSWMNHLLNGCLVGCWCSHSNVVTWCAVSWWSSTWPCCCWTTILWFLSCSWVRWSKTGLLAMWQELSTTAKPCLFAP